MQAARDVPCGCGRVVQQTVQHPSIVPSTSIRSLRFGKQRKIQSQQAACRRLLRDVARRLQTKAPDPTPKLQVLLDYDVDPAARTASKQATVNLCR